MNVEPLFTLAMLLVFIVDFAMSSVSLRWRDFEFGYSTLIGRGSTGESRFREIGRQDVYLLCSNIKMWKDSSNDLRARAA